LNDDTVILLIKAGVQVALKGATRIRCIYGSVSAQGFSLSADNDKYLPIYSPDSHSFVTLSVGLDSPSPSALKTALKVEFPSISSVQLQEILDVAERYACAMILKMLSCNVCDFVTRFSPFETLFVGLKKIRSDEVMDNERSVVLREIGIEIRAENESHRFVTPTEYEDVATVFIKSINTGKLCT